MHKTENRVCQSCKKDFTIEPEDFSFYEKMKVPPPTWCPECRLIRRLLFTNVWNLHWRNCNKCGKRTLSIFSPEQKNIVYCQPCWWSDSWDGTEYGMEYDSSRPFLEQIKELMDKTPCFSLESDYLSIKNSEYSNGIGWSKDCYLVFFADYCENVYHSSLLNGLRYSVDCMRGVNSESCYETIGFDKCYNTFFSEECEACVDVWFSRNCYSCMNCIGCANLRGASYCLFNVKYSKEEYLKKIKDLKLDSWKNLRNLEKKTFEFWQVKPYRECHGHSLNLNVTGEYVYISKNSKNIYMSDGVEDCKYTQFISVPSVKDCMDYSGWGNNASQIYESVAIGENSNRVYFSIHCWADCLNLQYCRWNITGKNNFGCVNLKRKQYCILNKQYKKEDYEKLKIQIIEDMKINPYIDKLGRKFYYGEFFPPEFSNFSYNESNAMKFFPKTKKEAIKEGYFWAETENPMYKVSINSSLLPDTISETDETILQEIIGCETCTRGYKIARGEFDLLRKMNLPIPHSCPNCRNDRRFNRTNKPTFYNRTCAKCNIDIKTPYTPDRPEIIYCEKCYQAEFL